MLLTNYQAEYGRNYGGSITTVTKAGTKEFHGGAYYFKRNEALNANDFLPQPRRRSRAAGYRYDYPGYYIGGPILIPGLLKKRDKLFFFWSQEFLPRTTPTRTAALHVPHGAGAAGQFFADARHQRRGHSDSGSAEQSSPVSGQHHPANRIDKAGQGLLNVFPLPNFVDPGKYVQHRGARHDAANRTISKSCGSIGTSAARPRSTLVCITTATSGSATTGSTASRSTTPSR